MSDEEVIEPTPTPAPAPAPRAPLLFQVKDFVDAAQVRRDLGFSTNDLSSAMMQQASLFAHYGVLAADASRQVDTVKLLLESTEAAVYQSLRSKYLAAGEKITEALLEKQVARSDRVLSLKKALITAKRVESIGKTAMESFRHRRDMLVQQGLISREERKGDLIIATRNARDDVQENQKAEALDRLNKLRNGSED